MIVSNVNNNNHCILVGDFNAHSQAWNCSSNDTNGDRFYNSIDNQDLFVHNNNTNTYINVRSDTKSNLDLVISTLNICDKINLAVLDDLHGSDHFLVSFNTFKLKIIRTHWKKFTMELDKKYDEFLDNIYNNLAPSKKYEHFANIVTNALMNSNPKHCTNNLKKILIIQLHGGTTDWEDSKCLADLIDYKIAHALATKRFSETIDFRVDPNYVWNKCKILKNKWIKINPTHTTENLPNRDKIQTALEKISPPWVPTDPSTSPTCIKMNFPTMPSTITNLIQL
ncbi:hypothetical protein TSAR_002668 [Trichomalopsis sarcophagae]|uniref:Endonuclease/exonuclease/phosphatase domain-containing protein n=1 Tax=Trichomalopsis sarcophagae TaxID=543379 RepID=A0A232EH36_9HYME|nr:hypothetical protein TSAR_002668 [Trichomalopsis sarcophagae]